MSTNIRAIPSEALPDLLPIRDCIQLIDASMREVSRGNVELPLRWGLQVPNHGVLGMMPGYLGEPECFGIKLTSLFPGNRQAGLSSHAGVIMLFEPEYGRPVAMMDAGYVTAVRTAAASAVATRALSNASASRLLVLGAGEQAEFHVPAMLAVRDIDQVSIWGRSESRADHLASNLQDLLDVHCKSINNIEKAISETDIICTVTASAEPIVKGEWLRPGLHINAVGASFPTSREIDTKVIRRSHYFVDYRQSALAQAGELKVAFEKNSLTEACIRGEIGDVLEGNVAGRQSAEDITLYRSLGVAAQDLAAAHAIYQRAQDSAIGTMVSI